MMTKLIDLLYGDLFINEYVNQINISNKITSVTIHSNGYICIHNTINKKQVNFRSELTYNDLISEFTNSNKYGYAPSSCEKFAKQVERYLKINAFS